MAEIQHQNYGRIVVKRSSRSRYVRLSVTPGGSLQISAPLYTPLLFIKRFLKKSEEAVNKLIAEQTTAYTAPMHIGKSHSLEIEHSGELVTRVVYKKPRIRVLLAPSDALGDPVIQQLVRHEVAKALRNEAKAYLPRRLEFLARNMNLSYRGLRFSHARSRWGSCSSEGVISLNIALMKLEFELIDYVIIHELSHLSELNHSPTFWQLVGAHSPHYKQHRKTLKNQSPHI